MLFGILNIHKPLGCTSHDVIHRLRKILGIKKIGHAGTLDPAADGVLPVFVGKATRLIQYVDTDKQYIAEVTFGKTSTTFDSEGEISESGKCHFTVEDLSAQLETLTGKITQQVPLTSATHYKGKKLYEYAHQGVVIEDLPTKEVTVYQIEVLDHTIGDAENPVVRLKIDCSSGTYIRCIASDLGKFLGCGAYLSKLTRTKACKLGIETAMTLEDVEIARDNENLSSLFLSPETIIPLQQVELNDIQLEKIKKGQYFFYHKRVFRSCERLLLTYKDSTLVGIGEYAAGQNIIRPSCVLV